MSDCIFEIHQLWQSGLSSVYSNCCSRCSFKPEIIKIGQSSHTMYSNNILKRLETYRMHLVVCPSSVVTIKEVQMSYIYWLHIFTSFQYEIIPLSHQQFFLNLPCSIHRFYFNWTIPARTIQLHEHFILATICSENKLGLSKCRINKFLSLFLDFYFALSFSYSLSYLSSFSFSYRLELILLSSGKRSSPNQTQFSFQTAAYQERLNCWLNSHINVFFPFTKLDF